MKSQEGVYGPAVGVNTGLGRPGEVWLVSIVSMHVYSCVQTHVRTQVRTHVCMCMCMDSRGQHSLVSSLRKTILLPLRQGYLLVLQVCQAVWPVGPRDAPNSISPELGLQVCKYVLPCLAIYVGSGA